MKIYMLPVAITTFGICLNPLAFAGCKDDHDFTSSASKAKNVIVNSMGIKNPYQQKLAKSGEPAGSASQFQLIEKDGLLYVSVKGLRLPAEICTNGKKKGPLVVRLLWGKTPIMASVQPVGNQKFEVSATGFGTETFEVSSGMAIQ